MGNSTVNSKFFDRLRECIKSAGGPEVAAKKLRISVRTVKIWLAGISPTPGECRELELALNLPRGHLSEVGKEKPAELVRPVTQPALANEVSSVKSSTGDWIEKTIIPPAHRFTERKLGEISALMRHASVGDQDKLLCTLLRETISNPEGATLSPKQVADYLHEIFELAHEPKVEAIHGSFFELADGLADLTEDEYIQFLPYVHAILPVFAKYGVTLKRELNDEQLVAHTAETDMQLLVGYLRMGADPQFVIACALEADPSLGKMIKVLSELKFPSSKLIAAAEQSVALLEDGTKKATQVKKSGH